MVCIQGGKNPTQKCARPCYTGCPRKPETYFGGAIIPLLNRIAAVFAIFEICGVFFVYL
jgi:hypothetical protein